MGLRLKFNVAIIATFLVGFAVTAFLLKRSFESTARAEAIQTGRVILASALSVRAYTAENVRPLIGTERDGKFLSESVPFFAAQTVFRKIRPDFPEYIYKEAALNPTNLTDRAVEWEADIINAFRNDADRKELISERETPTGPSLTLARPVAIRDPACLTCHSTPSAAPPAMLASYGTNNGFGWHLNETVGAQLISVPMAVPLAKARDALILFLAALAGVFALMLVIFNVLLHFLVIKPVTRMSRLADAVSHGNPAEEFQAPGTDEIASLSSSFNRMRRSLESAMAMIDEAEPARP
jgi:HAMP domain-containing protein